MDPSRVAAGAAALGLILAGRLKSIGPGGSLHQSPRPRGETTISRESRWRASRARGSDETPSPSRVVPKSKRLIGSGASDLSPRLYEVGFRVYSESDEDGILNYIFSLIGTVNRTLVDLGASKLEGSNTASLLINHGWTGLLIDGDEQRIKDLRELYAACLDTHHYPPKCVAAWITAENINELIRSARIEGEIDLLAIDLDGVDYWIWKAIDAVRPRVVAVEYQCILGPERCVTVPYRPDFKPIFEGPYAVYNSASLAAFVKLGRQKGYRLVGCQRYGYNAFFVRDDLAREDLPEVSPRECFNHPFPLWAMETFLENNQAQGVGRSVRELPPSQSTGPRSP